MIGASTGKSNTRAVLVQARKPLPISASVACVSSRMMEVLPLCTLPSSQTTGAKLRARSAMGAPTSVVGLFTDQNDGYLAALRVLPPNPALLKAGSSHRAGLAPHRVTSHDPQVGQPDRWSGTGRRRARRGPGWGPARIGSAATPRAPAIRLGPAAARARWRRAIRPGLCRASGAPAPLARIKL